MSNYKTLIFDIGDVLFETKPDEQYKHLSEVSKKTVEEVRYFVESDNLLSDYELGKINTPTFVTKINYSLGINIPLAEFEKLWNSVLSKPDIRLINEVRSLQNSHLIILASNTNGMHWKYISETFKTIGFELPAFLSFKVGYKKPDVNFFTKMFNTFDIDPRLAVFIDDNKKSIEKGTSLGMLSHQHISSAETISFLSSI